MDIKTKYDDAISIVDKSLVDEIEKDLQERNIHRSDVEQLILRSINEADTEEKIEKALTELAHTLDNVPKETLVQILQKLSDNGDVEDDKLSGVINEMLNAMTDRSTTEKAIIKENTKMEDEIKSKSNVVEEKCDEMQTVNQPFGGAKSLVEAKNYLEAGDLEYKVWRAYSMFGAVSQNILSSDEGIENKLAAMQTALTEFKSLLTPAGLATLKSELEVTLDPVSKMGEAVNSLVLSIGELNKKIDLLSTNRPANETVIIEPKTIVEPPIDEKQPEWKSIVLNVEKMLSESINKSNEERKAAFQEILNQTHDGLLSLDILLEKSEIKPEVPEKNGSDLETLKSMVLETVSKSVSDETTLLKQQMAEMTKLLQSVLSAKSNVEKTQLQERPVSKSINPIMPAASLLRQTASNKPMSIAEIARKSVFR